MRAARLTAIVLLLLLTPVVVAAAKAPAPPAAPKNVRGFLLRPDESVTHTFPRTPAFAWAPVRTAMCYEFELATSRTFQESTLVWSNLSTGKKSGKACGPVKSFLV